MAKRADCVFVAVPNYGGPVEFSSALGIFSSSRRLRVEPRGVDSSLLPKSFCILWVMAIQSSCRYWCMLHADITPAPLALDILLEELERQRATTGQAGVVSACIPIKNNQGIVSTAMARAGETAPYHRLTEDEVLKLPPTFDAEDVTDTLGYDGNLLVNTGLWVADTMSPWVKKVWFEINTRIEWDGNDATVHCEPEDWRLSRMLNDMDVPVWATQRVRVRHHGKTYWEFGGRDGKDGQAGVSIDVGA